VVGAVIEGSSDTSLGSTIIGDGGLSTTCSCGGGAGTHCQHASVYSADNHE
jgi:hypothetical protein